MADVHMVWAAVRWFASSRLADWLLAGAFALAAEVDVLLTMPGPSWPQAVTAMRGLGVLSLGYRRRSPLLVMALLCGLELAVAAIVKDPEIGAWATLSTIPVFVVSYSLGAYASPRALLLGLPLPLITAAVADTLWPGEHSVAEALPFVGLFLVGLPALAGWVVRGRSRLVGHLKEQTAELEAERATRAGRALVEERLRISSELHHVVSSTIQGLLTQIAAAEAGSGADGLRAVTEVETIARQGLAEMRRLLAALTGPDWPTRLETSGLQAALAGVAASGVDVVQSGQHDTSELDPAVELAAVRALQLFLDGAGDGSRVEVKRKPAGIELLLHGRRRDGFSRRALVALRERAALVGGTVEPSPVVDGPSLLVSLPAHPQPVTPAVRREPRAVGEPAEQRPRLASLPWPGLLAVADFVLLEAQVQTSGLLQGPRLLNVLAVVAVAAPLAWCRRRPLVATAGSLLAFTVMSVTLTPLGSMAGAAVLWLVLPFSVATFSDRRHALLGLGICGAALLVSAWLGLPGPSQGIAGAVGVFCTFVLAAWAAGLVVRDRSRLARQLRETNQRLIDEREATARQVVLEERARVAHELHDVIGHSLTVIVLQAGAARRVWETDRASALTSLAALARVARGGLTELLQSLDSIESGGQQIDGPKLEQLEDVLEMARLAGVRLELCVDGESASLSPAVELAAYRMVQEALTNAIKHAPGRPVLLSIHYGQVMEVDVSNDLLGAPPGAPLNTSGGHGLAGMRQRVEACGGTLDWGRHDGAFSVRARLPVLR